MQLIDAIKQRKTIKMFQSGVQIPREEILEMLELAQLAPSKANLQPWRFVVIDENEKKKLLLDKVAFNAPPCESASAIIFILADLHYEKLLDDILESAITSGCLHPNFRENSFNFLMGVHNSLTPQEVRDQIFIDTSLAAMQLMLAVKEKGYDSHAIGIFDRHAVLNVLEIDPERYAPVMLLAVGKAAVPALPSARLSTDYTVSWNNGQSFKK